MSNDPKVSAEDENERISDDPIVNEAYRRYKRAAEWESEFTIRFTEDLKFANGDDDNGYQWPNTLRFARNSSQKPCLTLNVIRQHNLMIANEAKQVKKSVGVAAAGGGSTKESADLFQAIIDYIEYNSCAQTAYSVAQEFQIAGGIGYWRLTTDYEGPDSMDLEIYIRPINDPTNVLLDPDIRQRDGSDAKWGFIFDNVPRGEFEEAYPDLANMAGKAPLGSGSGADDWLSSSHVKVAEYFRRVPKEDTLVSFVHNGQRKMLRKSRMHPDHFAKVVDDEQTRIRTTVDEEVEWYLIVGQQVVDHTIWPGKFIPIIRIIGEEIVIDGRLDRKGHTRAMKGAQRMFNYNNSAQIEYGALQSKVPWTAPAAAIENLEVYWNSANTENHSVLPWNHQDEAGQPIPKPERPAPPSPAQAYTTGAADAFNWMMMVSGQFQNAMGMQGNERTGSAIQKRQDQGATATFHFQDNYVLGLSFTGVQLIDLIPKIYDSKRMRRIRAEDGVERDVEIDPAARQAYLEERSHEGEIIRQIFNPAIGKYSIRSKPGPAYGTRREQTVEALTLLLTQNPGLTGIVGDILLKAMDIPESDEAAARLHRMVPPQALGKGPTPQEAKLMQTVQQLQALLGKALGKSAKDQLKLVGKNEMRDIDVYKAETDRIKALAPQLAADPNGQAELIHQLVGDSLSVHLAGVFQANAGGIDSEGAPAGAPPGPSAAPPPAGPPVPGAQQAPDGEWYMTDPTRKGKYLRVAPLIHQADNRLLNHV